MKLTKINSATIQVVGNRSVGDGVSFATDITDVSSSFTLLQDIVEKAFDTKNRKHFTYIDSLELNPIYNFVTKLFADPDQIIKQSNNIATYLYDQSIHPNIKCGDFYTLYGECEVDGKIFGCVALLKSERKEPFLTTENNGQVISVHTVYGTGIKNIDKGCLILNAEKEDGFIVYTVDRTNNGADAHYWTDSFLHVVNCNDDYHNTLQLNDMCTGFLRQMQKNESAQDCAKVAKIMASLLSSGESMTAEQLEGAIAPTEELKQQFADYKQQYEELHGALPGAFTPVSSAIKRKPVNRMNSFKAGSDFEIKILNPKAEIVSGYDEERGMKYYKLFFNEEK